MHEITPHIVFATTTVVDWIDIFTRPKYKDIVVESLAYCQEKRALDIYAWVLMSNHLHLIIGNDGQVAIGDVIRDFKKFTSKKIVNELKDDIKESRRDWMLRHFRCAAEGDSKLKGYRFWQEGTLMKELFSREVYNQKVRYIHDNPVRAGFVNSPEDYPYSSAHTYVHGGGPIKLALEHPFL